MNEPTSPESDAFDYRKFLAAHLEKKAARRKISFRQLSAKAGFGSPNYIQKILAGERNLSVAAAGRLAQALGMIESEKAHFEDLVAFSQAEDPALREILHRRLRAREFTQRARPVSDGTSLFAHWYTPLVWALAPLLGKNANPEEFVRATHGLISQREIDRALHTLMRAGHLTRPAPGEYTNGDVILEIRTPAARAVLQRFYGACLGAARRFVDVLPEPQRNLRVTTFAMHSDRLPELHERLRSFHRELVTWLGQEEGGDCVVQLTTSMAAVLAKVSDAEKSDES